MTKNNSYNLPCNMPRTVSLVMVFFVLTLCNCSTKAPVLGLQYNDISLQGLVDGKARVILFMDKVIDEAIYYKTYVDDESVGQVFVGTFLVIETSPGKHQLKVNELWTGSGIGADLKWALNPLDFGQPPTNEEKGIPPTLAFGSDAYAGIPFNIETGETQYFRIFKVDSSETVWFQCEGTGDTITMCSRERHAGPSVETISHEEASSLLQNLRQNLK